MALMTEKDVPARNKRRAVRRGLANKRKRVISKAKACKIIHDKEVGGKPLTGPQHRYMAARCEGWPVKRGAS